MGDVERGIIVEPRGEFCWTCFPRWDNEAGRGRGAADRLANLVQLCMLPWLGSVRDEVTSAPPAAMARLADRLGLDPGALALYGQRPQARSDHLVKIAGYLEWKTAPVKIA